MNSAAKSDDKRIMEIAQLLIHRLSNEMGAQSVHIEAVFLVGYIAMAKYNGRGKAETVKQIRDAFGRFNVEAKPMRLIVPPGAEGLA